MIIFGSIVFDVEDMKSRYETDELFELLEEFGLIEIINKIECKKVTVSWIDYDYDIEELIDEFGDFITKSTAILKRNDNSIYVIDCLKKGEIEFYRSHKKSKEIVDFFVEN